MIRSIYLVARRDYLGYVQAWGFWLGLLLTPLLLAVAMMAPTWAENSQPTRYFAVIESGDAFSTVLNAELNENRVEMARLSLDPASVMGTAEPNEALVTFDTALAEGASVEDALERAGAPAFELPQPGFVQVPAPANTQDAITPYLLGDQLIDTPEGPLPLFAAIFVPDGDGEIEYWSENVTADTLLRRAKSAERTLAERRIFESAGVDPALLNRASQETRPVTERRARPASAEGGSQVTMADRAPFYASILMAFMLWFLIFSVVNYLLMGTIEERSNKIFDSLLTSVKLTHMLAGKLLAVLAVALTLMGVWAIGTTILATAFGDMIDPGIRGPIFTVLGSVGDIQLLLPALLSFVLGYLMYGAIFLALGSLCDTIQEAQTLMTPLIVMLMVPMFMITVAISDPESPLIAVMSWVPVFTPFLLILRIPTVLPLWEITGLLVLMVAASLLVLWLAARVYRAGAVHGAGVGDVGKWFGKLVPGKKSKA
ncbi:MAG TPA: ABC transporter permease [Henriciella marina]|uniref:ABC transporter permease n=1 Tax=Henriciella sp. TaxID=1968823 RepID=UPI0018094204|nr:ABC transporter permease [Henriciella sp.]HIG22603.1 ABC transporter permease [Henriciella sp.]HIK64963.1 ABC transporter permease [Henriciella marina]